MTPNDIPGNSFRVLYFCDPKKAESCEKGWCFINGGPCMKTSTKEWAFLDENGEPSVAELIPVNLEEEDRQE